MLSLSCGRHGTLATPSASGGSSMFGGAGRISKDDDHDDDDGDGDGDGDGDDGGDSESVPSK